MISKKKGNQKFFNSFFIARNYQSGAYLIKKVISKENRFPNKSLISGDDKKYCYQTVPFWRVAFSQDCPLADELSYRIIENSVSQLSALLSQRGSWLVSRGHSSVDTLFSAGSTSRLQIAVPRKLNQNVYTIQESNSEIKFNNVMQFKNIHTFKNVIWNVELKMWTSEYDLKGEKTHRWDIQSSSVPSRADQFPWDVSGPRQVKRRLWVCCSWATIFAKASYVFARLLFLILHALSDPIRLIYIHVIQNLYSRSRMMCNPKKLF